MLFCGSSLWKMVMLTLGNIFSSSWSFQSSEIPHFCLFDLTQSNCNCFFEKNIKWNIEIKHALIIYFLLQYIWHMLFTFTHWFLCCSSILSFLGVGWGINFHSLHIFAEIIYAVSPTHNIVHISCTIFIDCDGFCTCKNKTTLQLFSIVVIIVQQCLVRMGLRDKFWIIFTKFL